MDQQKIFHVDPDARLVKANVSAKWEGLGE
jgi:hypothetical protein